MYQYDMLFSLELDFDNDDQAEEFMEELATEIKHHLKENEKLIGKALAYRTKKGRILTTEDLELLAKEAEKGYNVSQISQKRQEKESNGPEPNPAA